MTGSNVTNAQNGGKWMRQPLHDSRMHRFPVPTYPGKAVVTLVTVRNDFLFVYVQYDACEQVWAILFAS